MRQFAGFGTAEETNARFRYLLEHGQTGLSTAFDMPTLMGYDSDHPKSLGEVGREGVAVDSLEDMEQLFAGIPLDEVSTSMTINGPAAMLLAFYICVAEEQGVARDRLRGTIQTDILKEYIAQKEWIFPPEPSMRLCVDMIEFCAREVPLWHPVSISGYHIREAGSTAAQELAFTLADGFAYVEAALERGLDVDAFAPRLSFFFNAHIDFFEEIAKYRAARRIWAHELRERYGATNPRSWLMRFHTQTAGRLADGPAAGGEHRADGARGARGGARRHPVAAHELVRRGAGAADRARGEDRAADAAGDRARDRASPKRSTRWAAPTTSRTSRTGWKRRRTTTSTASAGSAASSPRSRRTSSSARSPRRRFRYQSEARARRARDRRREPLPGSGREADRDPPHRPGPRGRSRSSGSSACATGGTRPAVERASGSPEGGRGESDSNLMPAMVEASRAYVTMGEMCDALRQVWGTWRETPVF